MIRQRSSGDLLADRRYAYAEALLAEGDAAAALEMAEQALERAPDFAPAWLLVGRAHEHRFGLSRFEDDRRVAISAFERALAIEPHDVLGARVRLAALGVGAATEAMSRAYVRALYDGYAPRFERHLVDELGYCGPERMRAALEKACCPSHRFAVALDLGCGTGLMGEALRSRVDRLVGVDLSPAMLSLSSNRGIYDRLVESDLVEFLDGEPSASADLVVAADVLIYLGDLDPLLSGVERVLRSGGRVALTVQSHDGEGIHLGADGRFAHAVLYLREASARNSLSVIALEASEIRRESGRGVPGRIIVLRKP